MLFSSSHAPGRVWCGEMLRQRLIEHRDQLRDPPHAARFLLQQRVCRLSEVTSVDIPEPPPN